MRPGGRVPDRRSDLSILARSGVLSLAGTVTGALFGFALVVVITRGLHARGAGLLFEAIALFTILSNTAEFGADSGLVRMIPRYRAMGRTADIRRTLAAALWPVVGGAAVLAALVFAFAPQLARIFVHAANREHAVAYIRLLAPFLPLSSGMIVSLAGTRGFGTMMPYVGVNNFGVPVVRPIAVALVIAMGWGATAIALAWALPLGFGFALAVGILFAQLRKAERRDRAAGGPARGAGGLTAEFWRFSAPRGLAGFFQITVIWLGILITGALSTAREAGIYAAATRFAMIGTFAIQAVGLAIGPQISYLLTTEQHERAERVFQTATWWLMALSWPLYLALATFAPLLIRVFGGDFVSGQTALLILSMAMLVFIGTGNNKIVLLMGGKSAWNLLITAGSLVVNISLSLALVPRFGVNGAATAFAASIVLDNVVTTFVLWRLMRLQPLGRGYPVVAFGAIACYGGLGLLVRLIAGMTPKTFVLYALVATLAYVALLWRFRRVLQLRVLRDLAPGRGRGIDGDGAVA